MALHLIEALIELKVHARGSYISQGNTFNWDIEYIWVVAVALTFNRGINRGEGTTKEVATDIKVTHLMGI